MEITTLELERLNFYGASELHGGLVLGRLARAVREPELMRELLRHGAEEIEHARMWTDTILAVGGSPRPVRDTYQTHYARILGAPGSTLQVLALTQVFERRVYRHFLDHAREAGVHPEVRMTLLRMVEEEKHHLSWVKRWLDREDERREGAVRRLMHRYEQVDAEVYGRLCAQFGFRWAA